MVLDLYKKKFISYKYILIESYYINKHKRSVILWNGLMNFFVLKYMILLTAILGSTVLISGPMAPDSVISHPGSANGSVNSDSIYQFGSDIFYRELDKPGNEYMKAGVEGYSHNLVPTDSDQAKFDELWNDGVIAFKSGYNECQEAYIGLASVPALSGTREKSSVWEKFRDGNQSIARSKEFFIEAKSYASPTTESGFTIGMIIPKIDQIQQDAEDAEIASMGSILSDRNHDQRGFAANLTAAGAAVKDMEVTDVQLKVLSDDF